MTYIRVLVYVLAGWHLPRVPNTLEPRRPQVEHHYVPIRRHRTQFRVCTSYTSIITYNKKRFLVNIVPGHMLLFDSQKSNARHCDQQAERAWCVQGRCQRLHQKRIVSDISISVTLELSLSTVRLTNYYKFTYSYTSTSYLLVTRIQIHRQYSNICTSMYNTCNCAVYSIPRYTCTSSQYTIFIRVWFEKRMMFLCRRWRRRIFWLPWPVTARRARRFSRGEWPLMSTCWLGGCTSTRSSQALNMNMNICCVQRPGRPCVRLLLGPRRSRLRGFSQWRGPPSPFTLYSDGL